MSTRSTRWDCGLWIVLEHSALFYKHCFPRQVNGKYILKSGTDFRQFSKVTLDFSGPQLQVEIEAVEVTSAYSPDPALAAELEQVTNHSPACGHVTPCSPAIG